MRDIVRTINRGKRFSLADPRKSLSLSAIEGIKVYAPQMGHAVVPLTVMILALLFMIQRNGTAWIGSVFGPVMLIWFVVAGVLGIVGIARTPAVLAALNAGEAMDTMPVGARMLTIRSEACAPNEVIIAVEDSGPGIDPKDVDRVFDPFFTTKSQGMGMGLSICRSIIEAHHGQLSASPGITRGAVFQIALPSNK